MEPDATSAERDIQIPLAPVCLVDSECLSILGCLSKCSGFETIPCLTSCGLINSIYNKAFISFTTCSLVNNCTSPPKPDGHCLASHDQGLAHLTDIKSFDGDWWVLKGQNCGQDDVWRVGYDWYPCLHHYFTQVRNGQWMLNSTFCVGKDSVCKSDIQRTSSPINITSPGVVNKYLWAQNHVRIAYS